MSITPIDPHSHHYAHSLPFGAHLLRGGSSAPRTRFRLWAPSASRVDVLLDCGGERSRLAMESTGSGWFETMADCGAGTLYRYRIDDKLDVPDPASRFQPADVHGPSEVIDPRAFEWTHTHWHGRPWEETVLYEVHVGALGGYAGVATRLKKLAELGVTTIELMPLNDFPGKRNWGYDGVLPFAPDAAYGRPDELKALIDTAHGFGLSVMLDVVYNHFGPDGNFLPTYAQQFFRNAHTPWGMAIDFDQPEVGEYFTDNALYWLNEYRFDGLRFDAVHAIGHHEWLKSLADHIRAKVQHGRHVHLVLENEHNSASLLNEHFDAQWNDDSHNALHVLLTGEHEGYYHAYEDKPAQHLARVLGEGFAYQGEGSPIHDGAPRGEPSGHLPPSAFVMFLQNHDQVGNRAFGERLRKLCDADALRAATALLLLSPQVPMLFMDEEYGSEQPFLFFTDYHDELADAVREGRRREFAKFAAFADPDKRATIPDPNDPHTFTASTPPRAAIERSADAIAWFHFYQSALTVRSKLIAPRLQHAKVLGAEVLEGEAGAATKAVLARWRLGDGETLTIALNLGSDDVPFASAPAGKLIFETPPRARDRIDGERRLPPAACVAWLTGDVSDYAAHHDTRVIVKREPLA